MVTVGGTFVACASNESLAVPPLPSSAETVMPLSRKLSVVSIDHVQLPSVLPTNVPGLSEIVSVSGSPSGSVNLPLVLIVEPSGPLASGAAVVTSGAALSGGGGAQSGSAASTRPSPSSSL